jgi:hypothetical protein
VALATVLAYGYAGPIVCASIHGHGASASHEGHHATQLPSGHHVVAPVGGQTGTCADMEHCGLHLVGPVAPGTPTLTVAIEDASRVPLPAARVYGIPTPPATPPPRT